jgi:hypothetical protein
MSLTWAEIVKNKSIGEPGWVTKGYSPESEWKKYLDQWDPEDWSFPKPHSPYVPTTPKPKDWSKEIEDFIKNLPKPVAPKKKKEKKEKKKVEPKKKEKKIKPVSITPAEPGEFDREV